MAIPTVHVQVAWEDVTLAPGDVHVVGHYQGVLPQNAELALDKAVSSADDKPHHLVITDMTRRGVIRGALGDLNFVPWRKERVVLIAGMGTPGSFRHPQLRKLMSGVATAVGHLADRPNLTTVLIGGGAGNLSVSVCVAGLIDGFRDAFEMDADLRVRQVRIVERDLDRALQIHEAVKRSPRPGTTAVELTFDDNIEEGSGGVIPATFRYSLLLAAIAKASGLPPDSETKAILVAIERVLQASDRPAEFQEVELKKLVEELRKEVDAFEKDVKASGSGPSATAQGMLRHLALSRFPVGRSSATDARVPTTRLVFSFEGTHVRASAITDTVTVQERDIAVSSGLLLEAANRLSRTGSDSDQSQQLEVEKLGKYVYTLMVHPDIGQQFTKATDARVIEVDQTMAALPWEMLIPDENTRKPLGVVAPLARQLRTHYSPRAEDVEERRVQRALVISNPANGPAAALKTAKEAIEVRRLLKSAGIDTTLCMGPPLATDELPEGAQRAGLFETLVLLLHGEFDLVHFCGHATYVPDQPDLIGWLFAEGEILAARHLAQMRRPPLLVVANACNSAKLTGIVAKKAGARVGYNPGPRATAGLADEFFRHGIRDYVGTAIEVGSEAATEFAAVLYDSLIKQQSIGESVRLAREALFRKAGKYGSVWGAYQHYGDPTRPIF